MGFTDEASNIALEILGIVSLVLGFLVAFNVPLRLVDIPATMWQAVILIALGLLGVGHYKVYDKLLKLVETMRG